MAKEVSSFTFTQGSHQFKVWVLLLVSCKQENAPKSFFNLLAENLRDRPKVKGQNENQCIY